MGGQRAGGGVDADRRALRLRPSVAGQHGRARDVACAGRWGAEGSHVGRCGRVRAATIKNHKSKLCGVRVVSADAAEDTCAGLRRTILR